MKITNLEFYDSHWDFNIFEDILDIYVKAQFTLVCEGGAEYRGMATRDPVDEVEVEWDGPEPDDEAIAAQVIGMAFRESARLRVVIDPFDLRTIFEYCDIEMDDPAEGE